MAGLLKREGRSEESVPASRFDRLFDEWMSMLPLRRHAWDWEADELIKVDEFHEEDTLVIRAEIPGIDPEKDVDLSVSDHTLRIRAERREEKEAEEKGYLRREMRYGSFSRTLSLPEGVAEADITASYKDGILEIRVPAPAPVPAKRIPVAKA
jgi:HSP20 family protein